MRDGFGTKWNHAMIVDDSDHVEARFTELLVAHHAAVAGGSTPIESQETPRELRADEVNELRRAQACLELLERARRSAVRLAPFGVVADSSQGHSERSEESRGEILRCAQDDIAAQDDVGTQDDIAAQDGIAVQDEISVLGESLIAGPTPLGRGGWPFPLGAFGSSASWGEVVTQLCSLASIRC
jgi:hypothetical protein